jgi:hypothetical protein
VPSVPPSWPSKPSIRSAGAVAHVWAEYDEEEWDEVAPVTNTKPPGCEASAPVAPLPVASSPVATDDESMDAAQAAEAAEVAAARSLMKRVKREERRAERAELRVEKRARASADARRLHALRLRQVEWPFPIPCLPTVVCSCATPMCLSHHLHLRCSGAGRGSEAACGAGAVWKGPSSEQAHRIWLGHFQRSIRRLC